MSDFWQNIWRYPRFFLSSLAGLILVILLPFQNLFKIKKLRFLLLIGIVFFGFLFYWIVTNMLGL